MNISRKAKILAHLTVIGRLLMSKHFTIEVLYETRI